MAKDGAGRYGPKDGGSRASMCACDNEGHYDLRFQIEQSYSSIEKIDDLPLPDISDRFGADSISERGGCTVTEWVRSFDANTTFGVVLVVDITRLLRCMIGIDSLSMPYADDWLVSQMTRSRQGVEKVIFINIRIGISNN
jgi:hypothetical protein